MPIQTVLILSCILFLGFMAGPQNGPLLGVPLLILFLAARWGRPTPEAPRIDLWSPPPSIPEPELDVVDSEQEEVEEFRESLDQDSLFVKYNPEEGFENLSRYLLTAARQVQLRYRELGLRIPKILFSDSICVRVGEIVIELRERELGRFSMQPEPVSLKIPGSERALRRVSRVRNLQLGLLGVISNSLPRLVGDQLCSLKAPKQPRSRLKELALERVEAGRPLPEDLKDLDEDLNSSGSVEVAAHDRPEVVDADPMMAATLFCKDDRQWWKEEVLRDLNSEQVERLMRALALFGSSTAPSRHALEKRALQEYPRAYSCDVALAETIRALIRGNPPKDAPLEQLARVLMAVPEDVCEQIALEVRRKLPAHVGRQLLCEMSVRPGAESREAVKSFWAQLEGDQLNLFGVEAICRKLLAEGPEWLALLLKVNWLNDDPQVRFRRSCRRQPRRMVSLLLKYGRGRRHRYLSWGQKIWVFCHALEGEGRGLFQHMRSTVGPLPRFEATPEECRRIQGEVLRLAQLWRPEWRTGWPCGN